MTTYHYPWNVGFDRIFDRLEGLSDHKGYSKFPPYNVYVSKDKDRYMIEMAVAGFNEEELNISHKTGELTITGSKIAKGVEGYDLAHTGLANRDFSLKWNLVDSLEVKEVTLKNGILSVYLVNVLPEEAKVKTIPINGAKKLLSE